MFCPFHLECICRKVQVLDNRYSEEIAAKNQKNRKEGNGRDYNRERR